VFRVLGGAAGLGLKRNVKGLYKALARVYDPGDRIYLFGFSRGAFTVRTLAGLIGACGIVDGASCPTASALRCAVERAYRAYRSRYSSALSRTVHTMRRKPQSDAVIAEFQKDHKVHRDVAVVFIGVWDTVDAVGMPFALAGLVNRLVYQFKFPTQTLGKHVLQACHALAIDDARVAFEPVLWLGPDERIEQVWFAGVHSNVGGGYPKQGMSLVALDWMLGHAERAGLRLNSMDRELFSTRASVDDKLYDSRSGLGLFYRWTPRDIRKYCNRTGIAPRLHLSVAERVAHATEDYAPGNIPPDVSVATTPVDLRDPAYRAKQLVLDRRAEAIQRVIREALDGRYLLDAVRTHINIGDGSYWFFVIGWIPAVLGTVRLLAALVRPDPRAVETGLPLLGMAAACFALASLFSRHADHAMSEHFSEFWQRHQKELEQALQTAQSAARQESERLRLSDLRRRG
jgi:hypothetical protein